MARLGLRGPTTLAWGVGTNRCGHGGLDPRGPPGRRGSVFPSFPLARFPRPSLDRWRGQDGPAGGGAAAPRAESPHPGALATPPHGHPSCAQAATRWALPRPQLPSQQAASLAAQLLLLFLVSPFLKQTWQNGRNINKGGIRARDREKLLVCLLSGSPGHRAPGLWGAVGGGKPRSPRRLRAGSPPSRWAQV